MSEKKGDYEKIKDYIYKNDRLFEFLGATIREMYEGYAEVEMIVKETHLNAAKVCQGGVLFTLADLAFALASNSYGILALAVKANITYVKSAKLGDPLLAIAQEFHRGKNLAIYHVQITNKDSCERIAFFEGLVYRLNKPVIPS
ncbi:MAG: hotdog fold thioesterase [Thermodesulfobacteriaceae bacterium]|nr:hotdog fold thioesterase [Thermodesulfobacteriaceae bacterium]